MPGRKCDPNSRYRVFIHRNNKYNYASIQIPEEISEDGKIKYKIYHIGSLDENKIFTPNEYYRLRSIEERNKYIFPEDWDISKTKLEDKESNDKEKTELKNKNPKEIASSSNTDGKFYDNKLYGSFWLLEQIAKKSGLYYDLMDVFEKNTDKVNEILSLSLFPYLSRKNYSNFSKWQRTHKSLVDYPLKSPDITKLTHSISDSDRIKLIKLRLSRLPKGSYVDCDSTTRSSWGKCLADIRWGRNKDNKKLKNTTDVFVYSLSTHQPIYYRLFPGNTSDISTVRTILYDLAPLGFNDIVFLADRGYISEENIAGLYTADIPFLINAKIGNSPISDLLYKIEYNEDGIPVNMGFDDDRKIFFKQFDVDPFKVKLSDESIVEIKNIKANIYLDMHRRVNELTKLKLSIDTELDKMKNDKKNGVIPSDIKKYNALFEYYKAIPIKDNDDNIVNYEFKKCLNKVSKERSQCGFFASFLYRIDIDAIDALYKYKNRDEHEKSFDLFKNHMRFNIQRNWTEDGKNGRTFIAFTGLIIISILRNIWKTTLKSEYSSTFDMLDEMSGIRYCVFTNGKSHITSFTHKQVEISRACGVEPPTECIPKILRNKKKN